MYRLNTSVFIWKNRYRRQSRRFGRIRTHLVTRCDEPDTTVRGRFPERSTRPLCRKGRPSPGQKLSGASGPWATLPLSYRLTDRPTETQDSCLIRPVHIRRLRGPTGVGRAGSSSPPSCTCLRSSNRGGGSCGADPSGGCGSLRRYGPAPSSRLCAAPPLSAATTCNGRLSQHRGNSGLLWRFP